MPSSRWEQYNKNLSGSGVIHAGFIFKKKNNVELLCINCSNISLFDKPRMVYKVLSWQALHSRMSFTNVDEKPKSGILKLVRAVRHRK